MPNGAQRLGAHSERETPVPIPNTEAKPLSGDDTDLWESSTVPNYRKWPPKGGFFFLLQKSNKLFSLSAWRLTAATLFLYRQEIGERNGRQLKNTMVARLFASGFCGTPPQQFSESFAIAAVAACSLAHYGVKQSSNHSMLTALTSSVFLSLREELLITSAGMLRFAGDGVVWQLAREVCR